MDVISTTLLCGFPRSGTTWLSKILDSSLSSFLVSEPDNKYNNHLLLGNVPPFVNLGEYDSYVDKYKDGIEELTGNFYCSNRTFPYFRKEYLDVHSGIYSVSSLAFQIINYICEKINYKKTKIPSFCFDKDCKVNFLWKSVSQSSNLNFLKYALPELKIIYIYRNPLSSIASMLMSSEMGIDGKDTRRILERKGSVFFKENGCLVSKLDSLNDLQKRALFWRVECENAFSFSNGNDSFLPIIYEEFVTNPISQTQKIYKWLNWDYSKEVESFTLESKGEKTPSLFNRTVSGRYYGVYRKPGVNFKKWKNNISEKDYEAILSVLEGSPVLSLWDEGLLSYR